jgi:hypothetical protein
VTSSDKTSSTWKDHPVFIASAAAVATLGVTVLVYKEMVIPTQTALLQNEIVRLRQQMGLPDDEAGGIRALRKKTETLEKELKEANVKIAELQQSNLFAPGNPYPIGLAKVKIGDSVENVPKIFEEKSISRDHETYWSVLRPHASFSSVSYVFDPKSSDKRITHIYFFFKKDMPPELLHFKLTEALGPPTTNPRKDTYIWRTDQKLTVYKDNPHTYRVFLP